jgi:Putative Ig domain
MPQPIWETPAGSLGVIPEGVFYNIPIAAVAGADNVYFKLIAGQLPQGIQVTDNGVISGVPINIISVQGSPAQVSRDVTSQFAIRAYTKKTVHGTQVVDRLADRTFSLTVTGQNTPEFITPAGNVGTYYDGAEASIQILYYDPDPDDRIKIRLISGSLPPGLVISSTGLITGAIIPLVGPPGTAQAGYDDTPKDIYPNDFTTRSSSKNFQFTLEVTDGKSSSVRTFEIFVYSKDSMTADTTDFTADNTIITADIVPQRTPILLTPEQDLGIVRADNYYAFQFRATDFDGDSYEFVAATALPPGLSLDAETGWLYGYLPDQGATEIFYDFEIKVRKTNYPTIISRAYNFEITITGNIETEVIWITPSNLGTINNGAISTLEVAAINTGGRPLEYRIVSGSPSKLPQGLTLMPSGHIVGRVSFNTFALDGGTTTFDTEQTTRLDISPTTFDLTFTFLVNAYSPLTESGNTNAVSVFREFTITVNREFNQPYESLYIKAMPPADDRAIITRLLQNQDIIPQGVVYRADDQNFGVASNVVYTHAYGLTAATLEQYVSALAINHYWKNITLGAIKSAQALDANGNVLYEAIYSEIVDNLVNNQGTSVGKSVTLPYPTVVDGQTIDVVYPNSLINMRDQVIDTVGQVSPALPLWMVSKQANGQVLGFTPAWVIAYVQPGQSGRVIYNINQNFGTQLNTVDFKVDRYEIDRSQTHNWVPYDDSTQAGQWEPHPPLSTTFDEDTTIFDGRGTTFNSPADRWTNTDEYDKYLVFPKTNILG